MLLDGGFNVKDTDEFGNWLLALYFGGLRLCVDTDICRLLPGNGTDPSSVNMNGLNLAHLCANCSDLEAGILKTLVEFGVDITKTDFEGKTALHHIALKGTLTESALVFLLEKTGLRMENRDSFGKTPLEYAADMARAEHHPMIYDPERWTRTENLLLNVQLSQGRNNERSTGESERKDWAG